MKRLQLSYFMREAEKQGRKSPVRVTQEQVEAIYTSINNAVFGGVLVMPKIIVRDYKKRQIWGECEGWQRAHRWGPPYTKVIRIQRHFPNLKTLIKVVAHEMVHQYEWDFYNVMTHGQTTFFAWEEKLRSKGIRLSIEV